MTSNFEYRGNCRDPSLVHPGTRCELAKVLPICHGKSLISTGSLPSDYSTPSRRDISNIKFKVSRRDIVSHIVT